MPYTRRMGRKALGKERFNITLPKGMGQEMIDAAKEEGRDRSDVIAELCRDWLRKRQREKERQERGE